MGVVGSLGQEEGIDPVSAQGSHSPHAPETVVQYKKNTDIQIHKNTQIQIFDTLYSRSPQIIFLPFAATYNTGVVLL